MSFMRTLTLLFTLTAITLCAQNRPAPVLPLLETGFTQIFDGTTLKGWDCDPDYWRVEGGAIVGETKADKQPKQNIFCIWRGGEPADFDLKLKYKLTRGNSGIQYRSVELPNVNKWVLKGYQADIDAEQVYSGQIYEERGRGFLALRSQFAYISEFEKSGSFASLGDDKELKALIKNEDWNEMEIVARGNTVMQFVNGRLMSAVVDDDKLNRKMVGLIGIQLHLTKTGMKMETKNIRIKIF